MKKKILVLYFFNEFPIRKTYWDYLYCYKNYSQNHVFYVNLAFAFFPALLNQITFDYVLFHFSVTVSDFPHIFEWVLARIKQIQFGQVVKIAQFQDEYFQSVLRCRFINELQVDLVMTMAGKSEWGKIYKDVDFSRVKFWQGLTGYIDDRLVKEYASQANLTSRPTDIGYRTYWNKPFRLGKFGLLKVTIAEKFLDACKDIGLNIDISCRYEDRILGTAWMDFLARCKYTIGVPSGASLLDYDNTIATRISDYVTQHPQATFAEVAQACYPNQDGNLKLEAISPRHFEACITKTCQILLEGEYNGILHPGVHYIPLKEDFSNLKEVLDTVKRDDLRHPIVENAFRDLVQSGLYSYVTYVKEVFAQAPRTPKPSRFSQRERVLFRLISVIDRLNWGFSFLHAQLVVVFNRFGLWAKYRAARDFWRSLWHRPNAGS